MTKLVYIVLKNPALMGSQYLYEKTDISYLYLTYDVYSVYKMHDLEVFTDVSKQIQNEWPIKYIDLRGSASDYDTPESKKSVAK